MRVIIIDLMGIVDGGRNESYLEIVFDKQVLDIIIIREGDYDFSNEVFGTFFSVCGLGDPFRVSLAFWGQSTAERGFFRH